MDRMTCGCGEERIPGILARGIAALTLTGLTVMTVTVCALGGVVWVISWWRDRGRTESEESFFDGFGRWEEEEEQDERWRAPP
ncbi:hypothetical protein [Streptomyces sp. NBC_01235]|uniref:hypothetical protein n=1 Tax=Streptomyces sp. NBC_01235 TaxID=2903788 RepID=UPI002E132CEF|nr:hypothetical protein OG289_31580 [Streptomyces sp. NBC_01235]